MKGAALIHSELELYVLQVYLCAMEYLTVVMDLTNLTAQVHNIIAMYSILFSLLILIYFMLHDYYATLIDNLSFWGNIGDVHNTPIVIFFPA